MKSISKLVMAVAFGMGLSAVTSEAHASFTMQVDCYGNNGQPSWATTTNGISFQAKINGYWEELAYGSIASCPYDDSYAFWSPAFNESNVTALRVTTNGSDTFWIDKAALWSGYLSTKVASWGVNNNVGYCISEDYSDGNNAYCWNGGAFDPFTFNR